MSYWGALFFTLYYIAVTSFWLTRIINGLVGKAVMRVITDPAHSWRHGLVVHLWQITYTGAALAGLYALAVFLGYWWFWLDGVYFLFWLVLFGGSIIRLTTLKSYRNAESRKEFFDLLPPGTVE